MAKEKIAPEKMGPGKMKPGKMPPGGPGGHGGPRRARNPKQTLTRLLSYMSVYKKTMIVVVCCIFFSAIAQPRV